MFGVGPKGLFAKYGETAHSEESDDDKQQSPQMRPRMMVQRMQQWQRMRAVVK